jgi:hypothetical protein
LFSTASKGRTHRATGIVIVAWSLAVLLTAVIIWPAQPIRG